MDVAGFLEAHRDAVLTTAGAAVAGRQLTHYQAAGDEATAERLGALFDLVVACCRQHRIEPALEYGRTLAIERHAADHTLGEVQTAVNTLEEAVWRALVSDAPPDALGYALGLVSTVLGTVKDRLACTYLAEVTAQAPATLRLDHLFEGFEGDVHPG
jgi:hypothetical protein